jgi:hypothetical protein
MSALLLYLLQSLSEFQIQGDPKNQIGFVVAVVLLTALIIFMNVSKVVRNSKVFRGEGVELPKLRRPKVDPQFYRTIKISGLTKWEAEKLEQILKFDNDYPEEVLYDAAKLDASFESAYDRILRECPPENIQRALLELFSIRNAVEYFLAVRKNDGNENVPHKFRRKDTNIKCVFYLVVTKNVRTNFQLKKKLVLAKTPPYHGILLNVSQSGCSIMSAQNIKTGCFLKIDFKANDTLVTALGRIQRLNMHGDDRIYHIKFLKLSRNSIIALNTFIFGYK